MHANCELMCLKAAGNAVKRASDNLVKAAQKAAFDKSEDDSVVVKTKFVGGIAQVRQTFLKNLHVRPGTEITPAVGFALITECLHVSQICQNAKCCFSDTVMSCCG